MFVINGAFTLSTHKIKNKIKKNAAKNLEATKIYKPNLYFI